MGIKKLIEQAHEGESQLCAEHGNVVTGEREYPKKERKKEEY